MDDARNAIIRRHVPPTRSAGRSRSLRLSVTDRCNLRCHYCMPEDEYLWLPREDVLTFEEISRLADLFGELAWTGCGSPAASRCCGAICPSLVAALAAQPWLRDLALTTNGVLLADAAAELRRAGLHRVTVSLDTLQRDRFNGSRAMDALAGGAGRHRGGAPARASPT